MRPIEIASGDCKSLIFKSGLYWRGLRINEPVHSVEVLPGFYIVPFSVFAIHVASDVKYMNVNLGARFLLWKRYAKWLWLPGILSV